jgi:hypothetical protein
MLQKKKRHGAVAAVSPTQMARLREHAGQRHADPDGRLLRHATRQPVDADPLSSAWAAPTASAPADSGTPP